MKKRVLYLLIFVKLISIIFLPVSAQSEEKNVYSSEISENADLLELTAPNAVLMENATGKIIYEKNGAEAKPPASVTKIMTLLLIFEDIKTGKISLQDEVTVSSHAASMGGSQVFLEAGETQTADTLIKCIAVSSANDACVAMAEYLNGSETAFVDRMNQKAKDLGMVSTCFVNCCGLDEQEHLTSARDIALMSKELTTKYPDIFQYSTIWMDEFTHKTAKGESKFGLSNTNKLIRTYQGCNGLKTGSTSKAGFCLSATAKRDGISLIAVVMGCRSTKDRTNDVTKMLDYGFANVKLYEDKNPIGDLTGLEIRGGEKKIVTVTSQDTFTAVLLKEETSQEVEKKIQLVDPVSAPVKKGEILGEIEYSCETEVLGTIPILADENIDEKTYLFSLKKMWNQLMLDTGL